MLESDSAPVSGITVTRCTDRIGFTKPASSLSIEGRNATKTNAAAPSTAVALLRRMAAAVANSATWGTMNSQANMPTISTLDHGSVAVASWFKEAGTYGRYLQCPVCLTAIVIFLRIIGVRIVRTCGTGTSISGHPRVLRATRRSTYISKDASWRVPSSSICALRNCEQLPV